MADAPVVHIGENSPEQVAYRLLQHIAAAEGKKLGPNSQGGEVPLAERKWILDTYAECIEAVLSQRIFGRDAPR